MSKSAKLARFLLPAAIVMAASPAPAQYQSRSQRVAEEVARTIRDTAIAVGTVQDALYDSVNGFRYQGPERFAVEHCARHAGRYGRLRVDEVHPHKRHSWRVYGTAERRDPYYDAYRSRGSYGYSIRCTVRDDGRVKLKTRRLRY